MGDDCSGDDRDNASDQPPGEGRDEKGIYGGITDLNEVLNCLASARRRHVLYYLQTNTVAELHEVATHVAAREENILPEAVTDEHRKQVEIQLVHSDLPRLADAHFIEYDRRSNTVRYTEPPRLLHRVLELLAKLENRNPS